MDSDRRCYQIQASDSTYFRRILGVTKNAKPLGQRRPNLAKRLNYEILHNIVHQQCGDQCIVILLVDTYCTAVYGLPHEVGKHTQENHVGASVTPTHQSMNHRGHRPVIYLVPTQ